MKRFFALLIFAAAFAAIPLRGTEPTDPAPDCQVLPDPDDAWSPIQVGFLPGIPGYTATGNVRGLKTGWPIVDGNGYVRGVEFSLFYSGTAAVTGLQTAFFGCGSCELDGIQFSPGICQARNLNGLQVGLMNFGGDITGFQAGVICNVNDDVAGYQTALVNKAASVDGLQVGLINLADSGSIQIGLINCIRDSAIPFFPLINFW